MNLLEAIELMKSGHAMRRPCWKDGIVAYIQEAGEKGEYSKMAAHQPYLATCHVATCELPGVRLISDLLATDWERAYPETTSTAQQQ